MFKSSMIGLLLVAVAVLMFLNIDSCKKAGDFEDEVTRITAYKDTAMTYKAKNGELITYNEALEVSEASALSAIKGLKERLENQKIARVSSLTTVRTKFSIDTVRVPFKDSIPCPEFLTTFTIDSVHYQMSGEVTNKNLLISRLNIPNDQQIIVGTKKNGFLKKRSMVVTVTNSNPYMEISGIQNYTITPKKKFYQRWYFVGGAGLLSGFFLQSRLNR